MLSSLTKKNKTLLWLVVSMDTDKMQCTGIPSRVTRRSNTPNTAVFLDVSYHRYEINSSWLGLDLTLYVHIITSCYLKPKIAPELFLCFVIISLENWHQLVNWSHPRLNQSFVEVQTFYRASLHDVIFFFSSPKCLALNIFFLVG